MESAALEFVRATKRLGLSRAHEIMALLSAYDDNITKVAKRLQVDEAEEAPIRELTAAERRQLDRDMLRTHKEGDAHTPILDALGSTKPVMTHEIVEWYRTHPNASATEGAQALAEKFSAHYSSREEAQRRIRSLIGTLSSAKGTQKKLVSTKGNITIAS